MLYAYQPGASLGMTVSYLGGRRENLIRWNQVYSEQGGMYDMTITYLPAEHRGLQVTINGKTTTVEKLQTKGGLTTITIPISLKAGYNVIEMGCPYAWAVDIDKFELQQMK